MNLPESLIEHFCAYQEGERRYGYPFGAHGSPYLNGMIDMYCELTGNDDETVYQELVDISIARAEVASAESD